MEIAFGTAEDWFDVTTDPLALLEQAEAEGWGDGLPLIPPTAERILRVCQRANMDPDSRMGAIPPSNADLLISKVAANAVMAGCSEELFPVVLTAIEAMLEPEFNLYGIQSTTHPVAPLVIVHGAAVDDLRFNAGPGTFGPGWRANATVGRAIRLCLLNIGGARPGERDRATQGQPSKYAFCVAENQEASPWRPYVVDHGLSATESAVTIFGGENPHNVNDHVSTSAEGILYTISSAISTIASNSFYYTQGEVFVMFGPEHAATLAAGGFDRPDVQSYLFENARIPLAELKRGGMYGMDSWPRWMLAGATDATRFPPVTKPDAFRILVVGGPGKHSCVLPGFGATNSVTRPLRRSTS